jgi:hypothetical protein
MQQATNAMKSVRETLDKLGADDKRARFSTLISTPVADNALSAQIFDQLIAIGGVRDAALMVRFSPTKETRNILDDRFNKAQAEVQTLSGQLPAELVSPMQALWDETTRYRDLSINYFTAVQAIKTAEDKVKVAGDDSSDIKKLIARVKPITMRWRITPAPQRPLSALCYSDWRNCLVVDYSPDHPSLLSITWRWLSVSPVAISVRRSPRKATTNWANSPLRWGV